MDPATVEDSLPRLHAALLVVASRILADRVRSRIDAEDVLQSAYRTFFRRLTANEFRIQDDEDLRALLLTIVRRKALNHVYCHQSERRDVRREETCAIAETVIAPKDAAAAEELREYLLSVLSASDREVLTLFLDSAPLEQIAVQSEMSRRSVCRALERIRKRIREVLVREGATGS